MEARRDLGRELYQSFLGADAEPNVANACGLEVGIVEKIDDALASSSSTPPKDLFNPAYKRVSAYFILIVWVFWIKTLKPW